MQGRPALMPFSSIRKKTYLASRKSSTDGIQTISQNTTLGAEPVQSTGAFSNGTSTVITTNIKNASNELQHFNQNGRGSCP
jgi:hypothetical protein